MAANGTGWIFDGSGDGNDYSIETVVSKLIPEEVDTEVKNTRLERALFADDDDSPILRRAIRLVSKKEWEGKRNRYKQIPYLSLLFIKKKNHDEYIESLQDKDLFLPKSVDLREWFSDVKDQRKIAKTTNKSELDLPTCCSHAGVSLMEYFQNRINQNFDKNSSSTHSNLSWRFLYRITRQLMAQPDTKIDEKGIITGGTKLRDTLKAMTLFGVPPAKYWLDNESISIDDLLNKEPIAFCYAYAQNFQASSYFRLDGLKEEHEKRLLKLSQDDININEFVIVQIRIALASGFPSIFGVPVIKDYDFLADTNCIQSGDLDSTKKVKLGQIKILEKTKIAAIKEQLKQEQSIKGHALVAVGYDDNMEFDDPNDNDVAGNSEKSEKIKGAFLIRNSYGKEWGDEGYGWLPYYYVQEGLATDWWSLLNAEWINTSSLGLLESGESGILTLGCQDCIP